MSSVTLSISIEVEGEDISDETRQTVELQVARMGEQLEATLVHYVQTQCPGLKIKTRGREEEE